MKTRSLECTKKNSKLENFPCEVWRNQENRLTPVKLESKKQAKKVIADREGLGFEVLIEL